jgi:hypothetical protein
MATISLPAKIFAGTVPTTESQVYTVPAGQTDVVTSVTLCNITDVAQEASVKLAGVYFFKDIDLAPRQITVLDFKQVLDAGDSVLIQAGNPNAVNMFMSGVKITSI